MALGWRGLIERYLENGALIAPFKQNLTSNTGLFAKIIPIKNSQRTKLITKALQPLNL